MFVLMYKKNAFYCTALTLSLVLLFHPCKPCLNRRVLRAK